MAHAGDAGTFELGDRTVNRMGFGAMRITGLGVIGPPEDEAAAVRVVERALELGVDLVDTADSYGPGVSERLLRAAGAPEQALVATKAGLLRDPDGDWRPHGDPEYVRNQALVSRDRLGVETIDCYQFHRPDPEVPFEDSVAAFAELKDEGLVEHVGLSNVSVEQLDRAREVVDVATVQNRYSVVDREHDPVVEACERAGIGFLPWYPLAADELGERETALRAVADRHDATLHQVALAWLLDRSPVVVPIPGTSSIEHVEENVAAAGIDLDDEDRRRLA
jgi:aryl-alcohol dehydrogenase-like predicted oxidoreductase